MGYSRNATPLKELPRITDIELSYLLLVEGPSASYAAEFADILKSGNVIFYGFRIDHSSGDLFVDVIKEAGDYTASIHKEWYLGGAGTTFSINVSGDLVVNI